MSYHLVDEHGNERIVQAKAKLNWCKKVSSIKPIYHRETPLIKALAKASLNETIEVDFAEYNKKYPKGSVRTKKLIIPNIKIAQSGDNCINSLGGIFEHKKRFIHLFAISITGFSALLFIFSSVK